MATGVKDDVVAVVAKLTRRTPKVVLDGTTRVVELEGYPSENTKTLVTAGLVADVCSMWRGQEVGFELTLTVPSDSEADWKTDLARLVKENRRIRREGQRRPPVEFNGVFAPGYPPHLLFCDSLSQTPELTGRHKCGSRYVYWLAAIPISDSELRLYDRDPKELIAELGASGDLTDWKSRS